MIEDCDRQLQDLFVMSNMTLNNIDDIANTIFRVIMNRAVEQILSGVEAFFTKRVLNMESKFNKGQNLERTMKKFIEATEEDKDFIIKHIKDPVEAEKDVFRKYFTEELETIRTESMKMFKDELLIVTE